MSAESQGYGPLHSSNASSVSDQESPVVRVGDIPQEQNLQWLGWGSILGYRKTLL
jgi:hypothetical protein